jgi:hypothetical protein
VQGLPFCGYRVKQLLPRLVEGLGTLRLEICSKLVEIDSSFPKVCQNRLTSPPSRRSVLVTFPCSPKASSVFSGMVLIVFGAASALILAVSARLLRARHKMTQSHGRGGVPLPAYA